jgi:hypothetical protein
LNARRFDKFSIMLLVLVFYSGHCWAESWQQDASARLSTEFDTNPLMSPTYTGGVWRELFEPSYSLTGNFDEDELKTGLALRIERSSNATLSPYRESPSVFADLLRRINAGEFGISSRYAEIATRYADIDSTGLVQVASTRTSRTLSGRLSQTVSERSTLMADVLLEGVSYQGGTYVDYTTRSATMTLNYARSELSTTYVRIYHVDYVPTGVGSATQLTSANLGLNWKTSDSLEGTLELGKSRMSDAGMGTLYMVSAIYTGQRNMLNLDASRQISPSGVGGFVTVDLANVNWNYDLNEDSRVGIDLVWRNNQFITDIINRTAGAWLQQDLNSYWGLRTYYRYNMLNGGLGDGATSNILGITLSYTHTDF